MQLFKAAAPHIAKVVANKRIVGPNAVGETCEIVLDHFGKMPYFEGQSYGIIPPGEDAKRDGKPYNNRLYSIGSTRYGDNLKGNTMTLVIRRANYWCPELKADDPAKKGICSNFLCDTKPGDEVMCTGPSGKVLMMPENPATDIIMLATGTGIAPYRSFLRRLFFENTASAEKFTGVAWLFLGVAGAENLLYDADWQQSLKQYPDNFRCDYALSREMKNKAGEKMYIQDKVEEYADEIFNRMDKGAYMYFCGLKGMMPGILDMFEAQCKKKGIDWAEKLKHWKEEGQWRVEVY